MKNYLKFVFAVAGLTIASFAPIAANAKKLPISDYQTSPKACGSTSDGNIYVGRMDD